MSAVIDQVKPEVFEKIGYFDKRVVGANVVRWVFNPLDLIVPQRKAEISWLKVGGEETSCPCLQRYGRGFMPRGLASILEIGGEPIPMQHLGDLQSSAWSGIPLNEGLAKNNFGFVPVFPGDGLRVLRRYSMNDGGMRKGIDELTALQGKEWEESHNGYNYCARCDFQSSKGTKVDSCPRCSTDKQAVLTVRVEGDGVLDILERDFFGDGMEPTLKGLEAQIRFGKTSETRIDVGKYQNEALAMCTDARNWATTKVSIEHALIKTGHVGEWQGGHTYSYSPVTELLLTQLEIPRQDQPLQEMAKLVAQVTGAHQSQGMSAVDMDLWERKMDEKLAVIRAADAAKIAELEAKLAQAEPSATYTCEHCHEEMKATAKTIHLSRWCKVLYPTETE